MKREKEPQLRSDFVFCSLSLSDLQIEIPLVSAQFSPTIIREWRAESKVKVMCVSCKNIIGMKPGAAELIALITCVFLCCVTSVNLLVLCPDRAFECLF